MNPTLASQLQELRQTHTRPHQVALGFATGTFFAIMPTFGLGVLLATLALFVKRDLNKLALYGALALWNPIVLIPLQAVAYSIGDMVYGVSPVIAYEVSVAHQAFYITRRLLVGDMILAVAISAASYVLVYVLARNAHRKI